MRKKREKKEERRGEEEKQWWTESEKCVGLSARAGCLRGGRQEFIT